MSGSREGRARGAPIDSQLWLKVNAALDAAMDADSPEGRDALLRKLFDDDPEIRPHVLSLLDADAQTGGVLDTSPEELVSPLLAAGAPAEDPDPGRDIGPYRVLRPIGRGGMGSVYLAARADGQFTQQVALKLINRGMDTDEIIRRFLLEREILARLHHPNIARLLDGGMTSDGRPYFAMEFVEGTPITAYADENRLTLEQRLGLFEEVCEAVDYAQRHLIVHRDLKPSNILVTGGGRVKLLDFGVAKLLGSWGGVGDGLTRTGVRLLTPEYAAPEQVREDPVTTATDVYALGAVLFELLSGHRLHPVRGRSRSQIEQSILEDEPEPLSLAAGRTVKLSAPGGGETEITPEAVASARRSTPGALKRRLRGDLGTIVGMALRKDPSERYPSAEAMLQDLRRFRTGLPVAARAPSLRYRAAKFLRRNRLAVAAVVLVIASLGAGLAGTTWQARNASREAERATVIKDFLVGLFKEASPDASQGADLTASQILGRGAARVEEDLGSQPEIRADVLGIIGGLYDEIGDYGAAQPLLEESHRLREDLFGDRDERVAESLMRMAALEIHKTDYVRADSLLRRALAIRRAGLSPDDPQLAVVLSDLAGVMRNLGEYAEAESLHRRVISIDRAAFGGDHLELAKDFNNFAVLMDDLGRADSAEALYRDALRIRRKQLPGEHSDIATNLHNLAQILGRQSKSEESEAAYREAVAIKRRIYRNEHPSLANSLRGLAGELRNQGDLAEADTLLQEALAMSRMLLGDDHAQVANCLNDLAILAYHGGDLDKAAQAFRESLRIWEKALPADHPTVWTVRSNLAAVEQQRGHPEAAEIEYRKALEFHRAALGPRHDKVALDLNNLGGSLRVQGRPDEAVGHHREALEIYRESLGPDHQEALHSQYLLARALGEMGRYEEAEALLLSAKERLEAQNPVGHRRTTDVSVELGRLLTDTGRPGESLPILESALDAWEKDNPEDPTLRTAEAMCALGDCMTSLGRFTEAESLLTAGHEALLEGRGPNNPAARRAARDLMRLSNSKQNNK